jgi:RimJ/RimL family protein N-acetyltransferase
MELISVYEHHFGVTALYHLLAERPIEANISHKAMPTWEQHTLFVGSEPYMHWYLIIQEKACLGAVYLSKQREIGIGIFKSYQGHGYGAAAVKLLMERHPGKFLANVAPGNRKSVDLFAELGFNLVQHTYSHE